MKSGAPPEKVSPATSVSYRILWFHKQNNIDFYYSLVPGLISTFIDGRGPFKDYGYYLPPNDTMSHLYTS